MYLFIFEDGAVYKRKEFVDADYASLEAGILEVIDISNPETPVTFYYGEWLEIESVPKGE